MIIETKLTRKAAMLRSPLLSNPLGRIGAEFRPVTLCRRIRTGAVRVRAEAYVQSLDDANQVFHKAQTEEDKALAYSQIMEYRAHRRRVFNFKDWRRHRSQSRYLHHIQTLRESGVIRNVARPVLTVAAMSLVVAFYNHLFIVQPPWLPAWLPSPPTMAIEPIQLTTIALSLLLVFRTNASYARWEEGRRAFGAITTVCRDLARQIYAWFPDTPEGKTSKEVASRWLIALAKSSMVHLRDEHELRRELAGGLNDHELDALDASDNRPMYCLQLLSHVFAMNKLPKHYIVCMDENVHKIVIAINACERILGTPIPLSYTRHTARFLLAWLFCIPFTLWPYAGWAMVPLAALVSFVLLGIEEIGIFLEEPFSVLSLEHLCRSCEDCIRSMHSGDSKIVEQLKSVGVSH
mmetsp:Transcript_4928/g.11675  ORF Transcript_4928/g.11675 Transcript_4928/m.11675 type:complete len:406 (+) Transcript_4928:143-1360(+)